MSSLRGKGNNGHGQSGVKDDSTMCRVKTKAIQITMLALIMNAVFVLLYMSGMLEFKREHFDIIVTTLLITVDCTLFAFLHFFTERG